MKPKVNADEIMGIKGDDSDKPAMEVLSSDDPWLLYEPTLVPEEEVKLLDNNNKDNDGSGGGGEVLSVRDRRVGFARHPYVLKTVAGLEKSRAGREILKVSVVVV